MFFLIGHRGVGKTSLVESFVEGVDLDHEILKTESISSFFEKNNEQGFRDLEKKTLQKILKDKNPKIVALGAGFDLKNFKFPENSIFIWIQRKSDSSGRVFFDRPRLEKKTGPVEEYLKRFQERQPLYEEISDFKIELEEGAPVCQAQEVLNLWIDEEKFHTLKAYYTISKLQELTFFSGCIELRTDFLSEDEILLALKSFDKNSYIVAIRTTVSDEFLEKVLKKKNTLIDLPLENKDFIESLEKKEKLNSRFFISYHGLLDDEIQLLVSGYGLHFKWSPVFKNFKELRSAFDMIYGKNVSFLPRAAQECGSFKWVRESLLFSNKINFYRSGLSAYMDQLNIYDVICLKKENQKKRGAVVGEEVRLSRSPAYHADFFDKNFSGSYSFIPLGRSEFTEENLKFIRSLGYDFFSVTSPYKDKMDFWGAGKNFNTVAFSSKDKVFFADTDMVALKALAEDLNGFRKILIWGAGTMGKALKSILLDTSVLHSVREYNGAELQGYDALVWCAGSDASAPNFVQAPLKIFDLEYKEHSKARQVAFEMGCGYVSGAAFFKLQADAQQAFWLKIQKENI